MPQAAVLNIDIYKSSLLKASMNQEVEALEDPGPMGAYHQAVDDLAKLHKGQVWLESGDGVIVIFPVASKALAAAMDLLDAIGDINRKSSGQLFVLAERLITPQEEGLFEGMPASQRRTMPPIPFLSWTRIRPDGELSLRTV
jgi:hypothetical protein